MSLFPVQNKKRFPVAEGLRSMFKGDHSVLGIRILFLGWFFPTREFSCSFWRSVLTKIMRLKHEGMLRAKEVDSEGMESSTGSHVAVGCWGANPRPSTGSFPAKTSFFILWQASQVSRNGNMCQRRILHKKLPKSTLKKDMHWDQGKWKRAIVVVVDEVTEGNFYLFRVIKIKRQSVVRVIF